MSLNARSIALQGIGFGPKQTAAQGLLELVSLADVGGVNKHVKFRPFKSPKDVTDWVEDTYNLTHLHRDDQLAAELLVSLVTQGFFNG